MLFAAALILLVVALALAGSAWAKVRESDRYIDALAASVSTPTVDDELARMFAEWRRDAVDTPYDPDRG